MSDLYMVIQEPKLASAVLKTVVWHCNAQSMADAIRTYFARCADAMDAVHSNRYRYTQPRAMKVYPNSRNAHWL